MSDRLTKGDAVTITQGDFTGRHGTVTDKDVIGDGITVALSDDGCQIETHEGHVERADRTGTNVGDGDRVVVQRGDFKGEVGTVLESDLVGDGLDVRLDRHDGKVVRTEEAHVARFEDR